MSSPQRDPDAMMAGFQAQIDAKLRQAAQLRTATDGLRVTESSPDSGVTITVDATGNVTDLRFTPTALTRRPDELAATVLATLRAAQAQVGKRVKETVAPLVGENSETMGMLMAGYTDRFGQAEPPPTPPRGPRGDDDDFGQTESWLRND